MNIKIVKNIILSIIIQYFIFSSFVIAQDPSAKPTQPATLTKLTDESITPVPGAIIDLIVKLTDQYNNPIPDEEIDFSILQGAGTLSANFTTTTYYGEAKVNLTCPDTANTLTQIRVSSTTNPTVTTTFSITTSGYITLTFNDIMAKTQENENKIIDLMADVVTTSNEPNSYSEKQFKLWIKGDKSKVKYLSPIQKTFIITTTPDSIDINNKPFLTITEEPDDPETTKTDTIESFSGDTYVLKTVRTSSKGFEETTRYYIDYSKGVITKTEDEFRDQYKKSFSEITYSYILIEDAWVMNEMTIKEKDFFENQEYTTTEMRSNIIINSDIPNSVFQQSGK